MPNTTLIELPTVCLDEVSKVMEKLLFKKDEYLTDTDKDVLLYMDMITHKTHPSKRSSHDGIITNY